MNFSKLNLLCSQLPRQIVTPYKPSEDLEQTPLLLPPTPTSPDSIQTASGYFSETLQTGHQSFVNAGENHDRSTVDSGLASAFDFRNSGFKDSNPFINVDVNGDSGLHNQAKVCAIDLFCFYFKNFPTFYRSQSLLTLRTPTSIMKSPTMTSPRRRCLTTELPCWTRWSTCSNRCRRQPSSINTTSNLNHRCRRM